MNQAIGWAAMGTGFTLLMTSLGASVVFIFRKEMGKSIQRAFLGFAAGVMMAASVWSLLIPAIDGTKEAGGIAWVPAAGGFVLGGLFLYLLDFLMPHLHLGEKNPEGVRSSFHRTTPLVLAVTLHNIPEGLAVGVAFGALKSHAYTMEALMGAVTIGVGIGLQNFPEGAAVSIPLRREGCSRRKSFFLGQASGMVEPIAGVLGAWLVVYVEAILPFALSFAAGAMILVAVHELIPECQREQEHQPYFATMGIIAGCAVMMLLDVMLG